MTTETMFHQDESAESVRGRDSDATPATLGGSAVFSDDLLTLNEAKARKEMAWERKECLLEALQTQADYRQFREAEQTFLMWNSIEEAMTRSIALMKPLKIVKPGVQASIGRSVHQECDRQCDRLRQLVAGGVKQTVSEQASLVGESARC